MPSISQISQRRVNEYTGRLEYLVRWEEDGGVEGEPLSSLPLFSTWEPRAALQVICNEMVEKVDQKELNRIDRDLLLWNEQSSLPADENAELSVCAYSNTDTKKYAASLEVPQASPSSIDLPEQKKSLSPSPSPAQKGPVELLNAIVLKRPPSCASPVVPPLKHTSSPVEESADESPSSLSVSPLSPSSERASFTPSPPSHYLLLLGDVIVSEEASAFLNPSGAFRKQTGKRKHLKRKKNTFYRGEPASPKEGEGEVESLCEASLAIEKTWKERFGQSFLHSCVQSSGFTPLASEFKYQWSPLDGSASKEPNTASSCPSPSIGGSEALKCDSAEHILRTKMSIIDLVPLESSQKAVDTGLGESFSIESLVGESETEQFKRRCQQYFNGGSPFTSGGNGFGMSPGLGGSRSATGASGVPPELAVVQELVREKREQMVVRCLMHPDFVLEDEENEGDQKRWCPDRREPITADRDAAKNWQLVSIPLTVFRLAFPQMLLDYLLEHCMVLESDE